MRIGVRVQQVPRNDVRLAAARLAEAMRQRAGVRRDRRASEQATGDGEPNGRREKWSDT